MQNEVREATKYTIRLEREDGERFNEKYGGMTAIAFRADDYLSNEFLKNLGDSLHAIYMSEANKHINETIYTEVDTHVKQIREKNINEKLHKKTD